MSGTPGKASDFKVYQAQFNGGFVDRQQQNLDALTAAARGAFAMRSEYLRGDYRQESFVPTISSLVSRRDTTSVSAADILKVTQDEFVTVKLARKIGPVDQTFDAWKKIGDTPAQLSFVIGQQAADATLAEKLNSALASLNAGISGVSGLTHDGTPAGTMTHTALAKGLSKFGDGMNRVVAWVMHSKVYFDLVQNAISDKITNVADMVINSGTPGSLNRPIVVTDSTSLVLSGTPDRYVTLGLTVGAVEIVDSETPTVESHVITGLENLVGRYQAEFSYNLGLKGYKYYTTAGANPDASTLATASSWPKATVDNRSTAGIRILTT